MWLHDVQNFMSSFNPDTKFPNQSGVKLDMLGGPVRADGKSYLYPGSTGIKNVFVIPSSVKHPEEMIGFASVDYFTEPVYFRGLLVSIGIWKEIGWGMIIYLAALAGINPNLYEAAMVDGAGRFRQMWSITLPSLMPAIVVLLGKCSMRMSSSCWRF